MKKTLSLAAISLIVVIVMICFIGCAGKVKPTSTPLQYSVMLTIEGNNPKTVTVDAGATALSAVQKAYTYTKGNSSTTINGTTNSWSYTVDGKMPTDATGRVDDFGEPIYIYIGNYIINKDCAIDLQRLIKP